MNIEDYEKYKQMKNKKQKLKNQIPYAVIVIIFSVFLGIYLRIINPESAFYWMMGICFGFVLQKSRFCFTAAFRDPYLTGATSLTRATLISFAITSIGFTAIKYTYFSQGLSIPGMDYVVPISLATVIGAFIFGIGIVISGGCASGTFMRIGEGYKLQIITLIFFIIGSLWAAYDYEWWENRFISKGVRVFLPDIFGWIGGLAVNLLIIFVLFIAVKKWESFKL